MTGTRVQVPFAEQGQIPSRAGAPSQRTDRGHAARHRLLRHIDRFVGDGAQAPCRSGARVRPSSIISSAADLPVGLAGEMSGARVERRLAAILAVDVAGYSRLMGA